jgi:hypothetical protein
LGVIILRKILLLFVFILTLLLVSCESLTPTTGNISITPKVEVDYSTYQLTKATLVYYNEVNEPILYFVFTSRLDTIEYNAMTLLNALGNQVPDSLGTLSGTPYSSVLEFTNLSLEKIQLYLYCDALSCDITSIGVLADQTSSFSVEFRYSNYENFAVKSIIEVLVKMSNTNWVINHQNMFQL